MNQPLNGYPAYPQPQQAQPVPGPASPYPQPVQAPAPVAAHQQAQQAQPVAQPQPYPQQLVSPYPASPYPQPQQAPAYAPPPAPTPGAPAPYAQYGGPPQARGGGLTPAEIAAMANVDPDGQRLPRLPVGQHVVNYESHEVVTLEDGTRMFVVELLCEQSTVQSAIGGRFKTLEFIDTKYAANGGRERQWGKVASLCKSLLGAYFDASWAQEMLVEPYETPKLNGAKYQVTTSPKVTKSQVKTDATGEPQTYDAFTRIG